jgi:hypothetical protein
MPQHSVHFRQMMAENIFEENWLWARCQNANCRRRAATSAVRMTISRRSIWCCVKAVVNITRRTVFAPSVGRTEVRRLSRLLENKRQLRPQ